MRIRSCGFCATDYKAIKGIRRNVTFPFIPGHEPAGVVAEVGPGVHALQGGRRGDLPALGLLRRLPRTAARATRTTASTPSPPAATARRRVARRVRRVHEDDARPACLHKPAGVSFDAAALTEPLSGAWKGVIQYSEMQVGDDVVVIGVGGIGLLCLMVARAAGAGRLIAVDTSDYARAQALKPRRDARRRSRGRATRSSRSTRSSRTGRTWWSRPPGPIEAVQLMVDLRRRGTRWNVFGITTHETFELDGGLTHFLEGRMDASFGTTPLAMRKAIRLMETRPGRPRADHLAPLPAGEDPRGRRGDGPARAQQGDHQPVKAIVNTGPGRAGVARDCPTPEPGPGRCASARRAAASAPPTWR